MKAIVNAIVILTIAGLTSCISDNVGPAGPAGPQGPEGPQGEKGESGFVFEYEDVDFTAPEYDVYLPFYGEFETLESDVALVYLLWDVVEVDGIDTEVWRQVPQSIFTENGILQYNFDYTMVDVRLFMEATFDLNTLGASATDDWVVRIVIVPGDFWSNSRLNTDDIPYHELKEMLNLPDLPTPELTIKRK